MRIPIIMAILLALLSILIDCYIWKEIRGQIVAQSRRSGWSSTYNAAIKARKRRGACYAVISVLLWIWLAFLLFFPKRDANESILPLMWMIFTYVTIYGAKALFCVFSLIGRAFASIFRKNKIKSHQLHVGFNVVGVIVAIAGFGVMWYGTIVTRTRTEVVKVNLDYKNLPAAFNGFRIVQISDLHVGTWGNDTTFVSKLVNEINALNPDVILFTGDIVNRKTDELKPFIKTLSRLKAKDGVYSVLGNHDYGDYIDWENPGLREANNKQLAEWQKNMGWKLLNNEYVSLNRDNDEIILIGVENWGEKPFKQYGRLTEAYPLSNKNSHHLNDSRFKILMSHNPKHWHEEVRKISNIDLTLSGHTHAMQMELEIGGYRFSPSALRYEEWGGVYENVRNGHLQRIYVNIGCGEVGMPFRIGATPEITLITLNKK